LKAQVNISTHLPGCLYQNQSLDTPDLKYSFQTSGHSLEISTVSCQEPPVFKTMGGSSWVWLACPLLFYAADMLYRTCTRSRHDVTIEQVTRHSDQLIELDLRVRPALNVTPGQFVILQCPSISLFDYHPYTLSKCPDPPHNQLVKIHMRCDGDWSVNVFEWQGD